MTDDDKSLGDDATLDGESPEQEVDAQSLGDQSTHGDHSQMDSVGDAASLGDQLTFGGDASGEALNDDMEIVNLESRYTIERVLGKGGMGEVLLATDTRLERKVAIKRILGKAAGSKTAVNRFLTEAKSVAALNHTNIVQIHDYGRDKQGPFLIMEYVAGQTLLDRCQQGAIALKEAIELTVQLCDGLAAAHDAHIVHRDVKPANILLTKSNIPKLTDFGLAKAETADTGMTQEGAVLGTHDFMPPEQRKDAALVDARSDLWSLAATLYQMLTGEAPRVIDLDAVPRELRTCLAKALKTNKDDRYQTAGEMGTALQECLAGPDISPTVQLGAGECPSCHTLNEAGRKFCNGCAAPLRAPCFGCQKEIPLWDNICGECGANQTELQASARKHWSAQQAKAVRLLKEFDFDGAEQLAKQAANSTDSRLGDHAAWTTQFLQELPGRRQLELERVQAWMRESNVHKTAHDYLAGLRVLQQVPPSLLDRTLPEYSQTPGELLHEFQETLQRISTLKAEIQQRVKNRELVGLRNQVAELLALCPERPDLQKLLRQLDERDARNARRMEEALATARQLRSQCEFTAAAAKLQKISADAMSDEAQQLLDECQWLATERQNTIDLVRSVNSATKLQGISFQVENYFNTLGQLSLQDIQVQQAVANLKQKFGIKPPQPPGAKFNRANQANQKQGSNHNVALTVSLMVGIFVVAVGILAFVAYQAGLFSSSPSSIAQQTPSQKTPTDQTGTEQTPSNTAPPEPATQPPANTDSGESPSGETGKMAAAPDSQATSPSIPTGIKNGLVAHYPLDINANDMSGNGNHGTLTGGENIPDRHGRINTAIRFRNKSYVTIPSSENLNMNRSFTLSAWIRAKKTQHEDVEPVISSKARTRSTKDKGIFWELRINSFLDSAVHYPLSFFAADHDSLQGEIRTNKRAEQWIHVVACVDSDNSALSLYTDGKLVSRDQNALQFSSRKESKKSQAIFGSFATNAPVFIGRSSDGDYVRDCSIDDVRIYNRALSSGEVKALYQYESTPPVEPPIGLNDGDDANLGGESSDESTQNKPTSSSENLSQPGMASDASGISSALRQALVAGDYEKALEIDPANPDAIELSRKTRGITINSRTLMPPRNSETVLCVTYSPDGKTIASCGYDNQVKLWDSKTGNLLHTLKGHKGFVTCVDFSPDGSKLVSGSQYNQVKLWDVNFGAELRSILGHREDGDHRVNAVIFDKDGQKIFSRSSDNTIKKAEAGTNDSLKILTQHISTPNYETELKYGDVHRPGFGGSLCIGPDNKRMYGSGENNTVQIWNIADGKKLHALEGHKDWVTVVAVNYNGTQIVSGANDNTARLWDTIQGRELHTLVHMGPINDAAFRPNGKWIATSSIDGVRIWETSTGTLFLQFGGTPAPSSFTKQQLANRGQPNEENGVPSIAFSPDGKSITTGGSDGSVKTWPIGPYLDTLDRIKKKYAEPSD